MGRLGAVADALFDSLDAGEKKVRWSIRFSSRIGYHGASAALIVFRFPSRKGEEETVPRERAVYET